MVTIQKMLNRPILVKATATSLRCNMEASAMVAIEECAHFLRMDCEISKIILELT